MLSFYKEKYPGATVIYKYDSQKIAEFMNKREHGSSVPGAIILDDCLSSSLSECKNDDNFKNLMLYARHYRKMVITTMQYPLGLNPEIRNSFDQVFLFCEDFYSNQKRAYDHYAGMFPTFEEFRNCFIDLTQGEEYKCMVINNRSTSNDLHDRIFSHKTTIDD